MSGLQSFTWQPLDVRPWTSEAQFTHLLSSCQAQISLRKLLSLSIGSQTFVKAGARVCHKIINHYCLEQHPMSHNKGTTSMQTHPVFRVLF